MCTGIAHLFFLHFHFSIWCLHWQRLVALRRTAETAISFLHPKKQGGPYPPMTHLAYPMMHSTTAMPHKLSSVSMATTQAFSFTQLLDFKTMGLTPKPSRFLVKATVIPGADRQSKHTPCQQHTTTFSFILHLCMQTKLKWIWTTYIVSTFSNIFTRIYYILHMLSVLFNIFHCCRFLKYNRTKWVKGTLLLLWFLAHVSLKKHV